MDYQIFEINTLINKCLKLRNKLMWGRVDLVLKSEILQILNDSLVEKDSPYYRGLKVSLQNLSQFYYVLQNVSNLEIRQRTIDSFEKPVVLTLFSYLSNLKTCHLDLSKISQIGHIKSRLTSFSCRDCCRIESVFLDKLQWTELTNLSVFRCQIDPIDNSNYFKNAPWLKVLKLSFCNLTQTKFLTNLDHLEYLDVSYNFLAEIPNLNPSARLTLETLVVSHNCLDSLEGLDNFPCLSELDLANNLLPHKYSLIPLKNLEQLSWIKLVDNPVAFSPYYRVYVASCLRTETLSTDFKIDGIRLNKRERALFRSNFLQAEDGAKLQGAISNQASGPIVNLPSTSTVSILDETFTRSPNSMKVGDTLDRRKNNLKGKITHVRVPVIFDECSLTDNVVTQDATVVIENFSIPPLLPPPSSISLSPKNNAKLLELGLSNETDWPLQVSSSDIAPECSKSANNERPTSVSFSKTLLVEVHKSDVDITPDEFPHVTGSVENEQFTSEPSDLHVDSDLESIKVIDDDVPTACIHREGSDCEEDKNTSKLNERHEDDPVPISGSCFKLSVNGDSVGNEGLLIEKCREDNLNEGSSIDPSNENESNDVSISTNGPSIKEQSKEIFEKNLESSKDSDESSYGSDNDADEILWQVIKVDPASKKNIPIFLALLENELKERCPKSGEALSKWSLSAVISCVKIKNEPITIEMEFDSVKKDKQNRTYVMEFADAQTLTKRIYNILESMPLKQQNQVSHQCLKCSSLFVHSRSSIFKSKETGISCPICGSNLVTETEEPKLPDKTVPGNKNISHSPSQSSTLNGQSENTPGTSKISTPATGPCSIISTDPQHKSDSLNAFKKYESDIEVISSPSQSSIEVIDENSSRSQSVTPRRKKSEDCQPIPEVNLKAVLPPIAALTESSSSGSLTESVVTAYDAQSVIVNKNSFSSECLPEESCENSLINSNKGVQMEDNSKITNRKLHSLDVYSYCDYSAVDLRVHTYIYQKVFKNENESLLALVKCHIWKTGGSDYDGCFVLSSSSVYFLYHNFTDFSDQVCDWLSPNETYQIADIRRIQPTVWYQGLEVQIKEFSFILLLMDSDRTENLVKHITDEQMKHSSLKGIKIISKPNFKTEDCLQNAVIACDLYHKSEEPSIIMLAICRSVEITIVDVSEEILRLPSVVITCGLFLIIPGDLSWLCSSTQPTIASGRDITALMDVHKKGTTLSFRFFDEADSVEETWLLKMGTEDQSSAVANSVAQLWEKLFSFKLEISGS